MFSASIHTGHPEENPEFVHVARRTDGKGGLFTVDRVPLGRFATCGYYFLPGISDHDYYDDRLEEHFEE